LNRGGASTHRRTLFLLPMFQSAPAVNSPYFSILNWHLSWRAAGALPVAARCVRYAEIVIAAGPFEQDGFAADA
jgi:hypothetical protein